MSTELVGPQVCPDLGSLGPRGPKLEVYECDKTTTHTPCAMTACYTSQRACPYMQSQCGIQWNCRVSLIARDTFERREKTCIKQFFTLRVKKDQNLTSKWTAVQSFFCLVINWFVCNNQILSILIKISTYWFQYLSYYLSQKLNQNMMKAKTY